MGGGCFPKESFSWHGKTLLSGVDPAGRANRVADAAPVFDRTLYLCPSPLYGYGVERLLSRIAPNSALLCIEAEPELFALSQEHLNAFSGNQLRLTDQCEAGALCALVRREWGPRSFRRVEMIRFTGGWQLFPALYDTLAGALRREIAINWGNAMTLARLGRRYARNAIRNLAAVSRCPSLDQLSFGDAPVLVLGAGPSLDQMLDNLPAERTFRIVCVDTCLPSLKDRGITPDLVVILESQHWNLEDFVGLSGWNVPAAIDLSALPRSTDVLSGGVFLFFTPWTELTLFRRLAAAGLLPAALPPLGSVGLSAVAIARCLTRGTIITAGLDFSFTLDLYHARSTPGHKKALRRQNRFHGPLNPELAFGRTVSGAVSKNGSHVYSSLSLRNYRDLFEREFGPVANDAATESGAPAPRLFDLSGSGLPLGIPTLSMGAALEALAAGKPSAKTGLSLHDRPEQLRTFIHSEQNRLILLRDMLTGAAPLNHDTLVTLIEECDYLWAHFPDYAAADRGPSGADLESGSPAAVSFLNRLRVEIDPFLKLWEMTLEEMRNEELGIRN